MRSPSIFELPPPVKNAGWPWTEESHQLPETMPDGSSWPRISVVTPSYNQGQFIEETIRSVLLQGYPNIEYIIIDGGSTDNSLEIIKKYEPWLTCWESKPDQGQSHAINKGWQRASGSILAWLNSDDMYMPNALSIAAEVSRNSPDAGIWHGILSQLDDGADCRFAGRSSSLMDALDNAFPLGIRQPASFFNRTALDKFGFVDETFHQYLDAEIGMRISAFMPIVFIPSHLARLRVYSETKTKTYSKVFKAEEKVRLFSKFYKLDNLPIQFQKKRRKTLAISYMDLAIAFSMVGEKNKSWQSLWSAVMYSFFDVFGRKKYRQSAVSLALKNILG